MSRSKGIVFFNEYQFNNLILSWQFKIYGKVLIKGTVTGFTIFIYNKTMQLNTSLFNEIIIYFTCWEYANVKNVPHVFILKIKKRVSIRDKHIFFYWYQFLRKTVCLFLYLHFLSSANIRASNQSGASSIGTMHFRFNFIIHVYFLVVWGGSSDS